MTLEKSVTKGSVVEMKCRNCDKDHSVEYIGLSEIQDIQLDNCPSLFRGLSKDKDIWDNLKIHLTDYKFDCECGQHIILKYNTDYNLFLLEQEDAQHLNMWQEFVYHTLDNIKQRGIRKLTRDSLNEKFKGKTDVNTLRG